MIMNNPKYLTSKEYNTIILNLFDSVTYINYPEECELIADKLFNNSFLKLSNLDSFKKLFFINSFTCKPSNF